MDPGIAIPRFGKPYVWVTWITGLLSGEDQCRFAPWFRARFKYVKDERGEEDFMSLAQWKAAHADAVARVHQNLEAGGWRVTVEDQNAFKLAGESAVLAGKPDLVAYHDQNIRIVDVKTGKRRDKDLWQVFVYLSAVPRVWRHFVGLQWSGSIEYPSGEPLRVTSVDRPVTSKVFELMRVLGQDERPEPIPSARECAWCDIPKTCCPVKIEREPDAVLTSEF